MVHSTAPHTETETLRVLFGLHFVSQKHTRRIGTPKMAPPPKPIARLRLVELDPKRKILAGHDPTDNGVFVVRKTGDGDWLLFNVPVSERDQALRSFLSADDSELLELTKSIRMTPTVFGRLPGNNPRTPKTPAKTKLK